MNRGVVEAIQKYTTYTFCITLCFSNKHKATAYALGMNVHDSSGLYALCFFFFYNCNTANKTNHIWCWNKKNNTSLTSSSEMDNYSKDMRKYTIKDLFRNLKKINITILINDFKHQSIWWMPLWCTYLIFYFCKF